jgi:hypothetical protein
MMVVSKFLLESVIAVLASLQGDLGISVVCNTPAKVSLHEPIVVKVTLTNRLDRSMTVDLGWNRVGAFTLAVVAPNGRSTTFTPHVEGVGGLSDPPQVVIPGRSD